MADATREGIAWSGDVPDARSRSTVSPGLHVRGGTGILPEGSGSEASSDWVNIGSATAKPATSTESVAAPSAARRRTHAVHQRACVAPVTPKCVCQCDSGCEWECDCECACVLAKRTSPVPQPHVLFVCVVAHCTCIIPCVFSQGCENIFGFGVRGASPRSPFRPHFSMMSKRWLVEHSRAAQIMAVNLCRPCCSKLRLSGDHDPAARAISTTAPSTRRSTQINP